MDWDLWSLSYDPEESRFCSQLESLCDFYFGYGFDFLEEDALDEKCCIQVLRILITNADNEISELEEDLISLQSELAWIENEEWADICCDALREKITCLDISVKSLMNKDKNDVKVHLLMHTQPVETLYEILKDLLNNNLCKKNEQPKEIKDGIILNSDDPKEAINIMGENKKRGHCNSEFILRKGMRESSSNKECAAVHLSLKLQEGNNNKPEIVEPATNPQPIKATAGHLDEKILSGHPGPKSTGKGGGRKQAFIPEDKRMIQNSGSKSADKGRCIVNKIKIQPTNVGVSNAISDASKYADGNSNKKKKSSTSDSNIESEIEEQSSISSADVSLCSSMKLEVKQTDPCKEVKHADFVKNVSAEELKCATEVNGKKGVYDSGFSTSNIPDIKHKLCDFSLKAARRQIIKDSKVVAKEKVILLNSSLKAEGRQKRPERIVKVVEADLTQTENCALISLLEESDKKGKNVIKLQPNEEGKVMPEVQVSEIAADEKKFELKMSKNLQKEKVNRMSNPPILQEIGISTMVVDFSASFTSKAKKRPKSFVRPLNTKLHLDCRATRKVVQPREFEPNQNSNCSDDSPKSLSRPQKKRKKSNFLSIADVEEISHQMDFTSSHRGTTDSLSKNDLLSNESSSSDSSSEAAPTVPSALILEKMKLTDLRDLAKRHGLTKYYSLSKKAILQQLAGRTDNC